MLIMFGAKRAQQVRNHQVAKALVNEHGERAKSFVRERIAATAWRSRDQAHWFRVEKHVKALLR